MYKAIGIFDSGFGGLSTLREIGKELPDYNYIYLGDSARAPYGGKAPGEIYQFTKEAADFLFRQGCMLIILACNTASSNALRRLQQEYLPQHYPQRRILGVLVPTSEAAAGNKSAKKIGVMATEATVASGAFVREIQKLKPKTKVFQQSCPLLVPLIESGEKGEYMDYLIRKYWRPLKHKNLDSLVLGCTHYGLIKEELCSIIGPKIRLISEGEIVAQKLKDYLQRHPEIEKEIERDKQKIFFTTNTTERFRSLGSKFFGEAIEPVKVKLS